MNKQIKPPLRLEPVRRGPIPVEGWLEGIDPAAEKAARAYLYNQCLDIPFNDTAAIKRHARELHRKGLPEEWIADHLINLCIHWPQNYDFAIRKAVEDAYRKAEMFKDLAPESDGERFKGKSFDQLMNLPPVEWLWKDILAANSLFVLYGREKAGKTYFMLSLALAIATRREFCGLPVRWGRVLYIIGEGNESEYANRLRAWLGAQGKAERNKLEELIRNNFMTVPVPVMINTEEQVRALLKENPGEWDLVVIDTYMRNTTGNVNDPQDAAAFVRGCDTIRTETGAAVVVVHHQGKDEKRGAFGSMHLTGSCDGAAKIIRQGKERIFRIDLMRNGDDSRDDIVYELVTTLARMTGEGEEQESCYVQFVERRRKGSKPQANERDMLLWTIYHESPQNRDALASRMGVSVKTLGRKLAPLREAGLLGPGVALTAEGRKRAEALDMEED